MVLETCPFHKDKLFTQVQILEHSHTKKISVILAYEAENLLPLCYEDCCLSCFFKLLRLDLYHKNQFVESYYKYKIL